MSDNPEHRRNWRTTWLTSIQEFADDKRQRQLWLEPTNANPHYSFVEYICCYFDDLRPKEGYRWPLEEGFVSADEVAAVTAFHSTADAYNSPKGDYNQEAILADPQWAIVVAAAKGAQANLLALLDDPRERHALIEG